MLWLLSQALLWVIMIYQKKIQIEMRCEYSSTIDSYDQIVSVVLLRVSYVSYI